MHQRNKICSKCGAIIPHTDLSLCNDCNQALIMVNMYLNEFNAYIEKRNQEYIKNQVKVHNYLTGKLEIKEDEKWTIETLTIVFKRKLRTSLSNTERTIKEYLLKWDLYEEKKSLRKSYLVKKILKKRYIKNMGFKKDSITDEMIELERARQLLQIAIDCIYPTRKSVCKTQ